MTAQEISSQPEFRGPAKANNVPVARLIGLKAKDIGDGRATVALSAGPQHANPMWTLHGGILCDVADAAMGMAFASTPCQRNPSHGRAENHPFARFTGPTQSGRNGRAAGPNNRICGMCHNR
jgi:hypothetical protein